MKLSVIIPCKDEEGNVKNIFEKLKKSLGDIKYELIFVDDGSSDKTLTLLRELNSNHPSSVKVISFSRNFKKEAAMYAGLTHSKGEYTCIIDGDLQQNPDYLVKMLEFLDNNKDFDQVAMVQEKRKEGSIMSFFKQSFYKIISKLSEIEFVNAASDFRMFRANVRTSILSVSEQNRFSKGIFAWIGFNTKYLPYKVEERGSGKTKFNMRASFRYALDGILSFSTKPLRFATYFGVISSISAFIYFFVIVIQKLFFEIDLPGYASTMCVILLIGGIQLITIGILGEYLAKTYIETKRRPIFIVKEKLGFDDDNVL